VPDPTTAGRSPISREGMHECIQVVWVVGLRGRCWRRE
jgi:hypothetical protein